MNGSSGLDELLLVLDWMLDQFDHLTVANMPPVVKDAYLALKQRQAEHQPFDDAKEAV